MTESDRERRQGCARGAVVGHSGVPSLVCCSLGPLRVRPSVRSSRRLPRARRGERENKNGRERIGGLFYWRRSRGAGGKESVVLFATGKRESIFRGKKRETWFASLASRDAEPIVSVFCVRTEGGGMDAG